MEPLLLAGLLIGIAVVGALCVGWLADRIAARVRRQVNRATLREWPVLQPGAIVRMTKESR